METRTLLFLCLGMVVGGCCTTNTVTCERYCDALASNCAGQVYSDQASCETMCATSRWPRGEEGAESGNSLACRLTWARVAARLPETGCRAAASRSPLCEGSNAHSPVGVVDTRVKPDPGPLKTPGLEPPPPIGAPRAGEPPPPLEPTEPKRPPPAATPASRPMGKCVIGLWDSSDRWGRSRGAAKRAKKTMRGVIKPALKRLGLSLKLVDVAKGVPSDAKMGACRGIITLFEDYDMVDAEGFNAWMAGQIQGGRLVLMINSYGALRDRKTKYAVPQHSTDQVFDAMGVRYRGWEINNRKDMFAGPVGKDLGVFTPSGPARPNVARHVRVFTDPAPDVVVHQWVGYVDPFDRKTKGESAVVFTCPRGGMALIRYFESASTRVRYVDITALITRAGFLFDR